MSPRSIIIDADRAVGPVNLKYNQALLDAELGLPIRPQQKYDRVESDRRTDSYLKEKLKQVK